ncbi:MAG: polyphenol oxidase family protein [Desulfarculaceae bacterium]
MIKVRQGGVPLLHFPGLSQLPGIIHAVTTRHGGVSQPPYESLNLGLAQDDDPESVQVNTEKVRRALGLERLVFSYQVHGTTVSQVNGEEVVPIQGSDGLCTGRPGVGLLIKQADCQAVILTVPGRMVANLHVGWRGNVSNMPGRGVEFVCRHFGVEPADILAAVSPSLGPCCAEFINHESELGPDFLPYQVGPNHFNLWRVTVDQLTAAGLLPRNIEVSGVCNKCSQDFFSYRREGPRSGRFGTVVALGNGAGA